MNIVVLAGGLSTERDVSINSGKEISSALIKNSHNVVLLDVFMGYEKEIDDIDSLFKNNMNLIEESSIAEEIPDLQKIKAKRKDKSDSFFGQNVIKLCQYADICFLALHGGEGENGQLQAAFDMLGIKYTGTDYLSAAISMDKSISKDIFKNHDVPTPDSLLLSDISEKGKIDFLPCVVKPCQTGSSVGISIVDKKEDLDKALETAFSFNDRVIVEQYVKGREFSVGIIDNKALPVIEIIPKNGWFDYKNKYQSGATEEICPANITDEIKNKMQKEAEHVFSVLDLKVYSRIDFLLDDNNDIYCLEANTLPGMTPASLLPKEAKADNIGYETLCEKIVTLSLEKYKG